MSLAAFNPGVRAELARSADTAAAFTPASIPGLMLWLDPSDDSTITYSSGSVPSVIADKGHLNTAWSITGDTLSAQSFSFSGTSGAYEINTIAGKGNGNKFLVLDPSSNYASATATLTPTGSPYNLTSGAGSAAVESDWFLWQVLYLDSSSTATNYSYFMRGVEGNSPAELTELRSASAYNFMRGSWVSSNSFQSVPGETHPWGYVSFLGCQSYDDGGTRKYRYTQDGVNWIGSTAHGRTNATPSAAGNVWQYKIRTSTGLQVQGIGDAGFVSGAISAADMKALYDYLDAKWGFDLP